MNASKSFRRLLLASGLTALMLALAVTGPILVGWLLEHGPDTATATASGSASVSSQNSLFSCLFLPTLADWPSHVLSYMLSVVALVGLLLGSGSFIGQWYRTRRTIRALYRLPQPMVDAGWHHLLLVLKLDSRVDLIAADKPLAFCHGWVRPRICISTGVVARLNESEVKALLLHERHHLLRRDPLKSAISRVLASAFFFLPVIRALQQQYMVAKEIEADEHVLLGQGSNRPLLGALYKLLLQQTHPHGSNEAGALAVAGSTDEVNQRLDYLLNGRPPSGLRLPILFASSATVAAIIIVMVIATWASAASALWHQAHITLGGC